MEVRLSTEFFKVCAAIILAPAIFKNFEFDKILVYLFYAIYSRRKVPNVSGALYCA